MGKDDSRIIIKNPVIGLFGLDKKNPYQCLEDDFARALEHFRKAFDGPALTNAPAMMEGTMELFKTNTATVLSFLINVTRLKPMTDDEVRVQAGAFVKQFNDQLLPAVERFIEHRNEVEMDDGSPTGRA
jgi:hypothetical protein